MEVTIDIPDVLASNAKSIGLSPETYVERLLERFAAASADDESVRERLREELSTGWEHDRSSGLHRSGKEVDAWLAGLEEGKLKKPSALHKKSDS